METKTVAQPTAVQGQPDQEIFELADRSDEEQILAELSGRVTDKYIYEFPSSEGPVTGLSYVGTNWACREYAKRGEAIRIVTKPEIQPDPIDSEYIVVSVVAQRYAVDSGTGREIALDSAVGVKRQWTKMQKKDGSIVFNKFFIEHGVNKAQRNAKQALLPTDFVKKMIQAALDIKHGRKPAAPGKTPQSASKPPAKPAAAAATPAAAPTGGAKPATAPAASKPAAAPAKGADPMTALRQKLWITLKKAAGITKDDEARKLLKELVGVDKTSDLDEASIKALGNTLVAVTRGANQLGKDADGFAFISVVATGEQLYPTAGVEGGPPAEEAPPAEEPPPADTGEAMF